MPGSINGIGTSYCGKNRLHHTQGQCEFCGQQATISSFDTVEYIIFLFVPLIPLRKLRVVGECSGCRRHRALPLKDWNTAKDQAIVEVVGNLKSNPRDVEAAKEAVKTAIGFQDEPLFQAAVKSVEASLGNDASVLAIIGEGQRYFGHLPQAVDAYRKSLAAEDSEQTREHLSVILLKLGQPQQAEKLLTHICETGQDNKLGYLWLLVFGYQSEGMHREALAVMERIAAIHPTASSDGEFCRLKSLSEKHQATSKRIANPLLNSNEAKYKETSFSGKIGPLIGPIVAVGLILAYLGSAAYYGNNRSVYVVNGLSIPYTATINGKKVELLAESRQRIQLPEGTVTISVDSPQMQIPESQVSMLSNFYGRPFFRQTWIINPDATAFVTWEKTYYAERADQIPEGDHSVKTGDTLYGFPSVDFEFESFPQSLEVEGGGTRSRTRVATLPTATIDPMQLFSFATNYYDEGDERLARWVSTKQESEPESEPWLGLLNQLMTPEETLAHLRTQLDRRPVRINVHRVYQSLMETTQAEYDLVAEYSKLHEANPNSGEFAYLLGRIESSVDKSTTLFHEALAATPPVPYAALALGKQHMAQGDFEQALQFAEQAITLQATSNLTFDWFRKDCWLATGRYRQLVDWLNSRNFPLSDVSEMLLTSVQAETLLGEQAIETDRTRVQRALGAFGGSAELVDPFVEKLGEVREYVLAVDDEQQAVPEYLVQQDIDQVKAASDEVPTHASWLLLYAAAQASGDQEAAQGYLQSAIEELRVGNSEMRTLATALGAEGQSDPVTYLSLVDEAASKRIWLAALAERFPDDRDEFRDLGQKLNFDRKPPYFWLRKYWEN